MADKYADAIYGIIEAKYGASRAEITSLSRRHRVSDWRKIIGLILHETGYGLTEIAKLTGKEDHSTACNSLARGRDMIETEPESMAKYLFIKAELEKVFKAPIIKTEEIELKNSGRRIIITIDLV